MFNVNFDTATSGIVENVVAMWDHWAMGTNVGHLDRITVNPEISHGKPTIRGMRWPVQNLLELLASGMTYDEVFEDHPVIGSVCLFVVRLGERHEFGYHRLIIH